MSDQKHKHKSKAPYQNYLVPGVIGVFFLVVIGFVIRVVLTDVGPRKKEQISTVTLLKPPPEVKEKPPEPEIQKEIPKQEVIQDIPQPQDTPQNNDSQDDTPAGNDLGVEGEGGAGGDAFGLVGKGKKGRDITLGGGGGGGGVSRLSLMAKYGWYSRKIEDEITKEVMKKLGSAPKGKYQILVKITLDSRGKIVRHRIVDGSGNSTIDDAVEAILGDLQISEPRPEGMPPALTLRLSMHGKG